jgi:glycosyltransferase involved in cell wall biosynthesis
LYQRGALVQKASALLRDFVRRFTTVLRRRQVDVVFLHREAAMLGPAIIERVLHWLGVPFVYDFDDAVYVPYVSPANGVLSHLKFPQKTGTICALADHVLAGNQVLADYASAYTDRITIVPTTIDTHKYRPIARYDLGPTPTIGWSGSYSSVQWLAALRPVLQELARRQRFRLLVIGAEFQCDGVEVECRPWRAETEVEDLAAIDIGVMPLVDDIWTRGKCALKALQYMALGIPTVVSPVGVNRDVVRHDENGLHATGEQAWIEALGTLLSDEALRRRLGMAGARTVQEAYSAEVHAPRVLATLRAAANRS